MGGGEGEKILSQSSGLKHISSPSSAQCLRFIIMFISPEWIFQSFRIKRAVSCVSLGPNLARLCWLARCSLRGGSVHNITPAARTHSAPFSEEKTLMAFV